MTAQEKAKTYAQERVHQLASKEVRMFVREDYLVGYREALQDAAEKLDEIAAHSVALGTDQRITWSIAAKTVRKMMEEK